MLKRLRSWWCQQHAPIPMAPQQMQALVEINLLEIHLAALDGLRPQVAPDRTVCTQVRAWLDTFRRQGLSGPCDWPELKAGARALNRELAAILAARQGVTPSPGPSTN